ncbi:MAG TPA: 5-oxoprolinase, partial [Pyrodictium sp.]|nr:5-oxoprolinase [Pyrodictium sp.]
MVDKVTVEVIRHAAIFTAEEMGVVLRNTAFSPNIRDRLDYSCAVLAPSGELVAQAEHIPVHLGS